jgi:U32 family peptidase
MMMQQSSRIRAAPHLPELLAPAGSPESFRAAVAAGADAVYLSGKRFGARKFAPNFTDAEIEDAVNFAHRHNVGVYVTLNTLIHDREVAAVTDYLLWLYSAGVDAVLVQDIGIAAIARDIVPALPLHASTQMTIHNTAGVRWAAEQGFSRVVLARELSLEEIARIAWETRQSGIGLEVFAHGALCYSFSGQCLLSSLIGGRSGNRGMCAQPCRKAYSLVIGDQDEYGRPTKLRDVSLPGGYLLSPKDLCTFAQLPDLVNSPIVSLKIEGRMKSAEYVSIVVSTYRRALDAIATGSAYESPAAERDLLLAFNRGFTSGYLFGERHGALMGREAADNRGICIGIVKQYDTRSRTTTVTSTRGIIPRPGDGLHFIPAGDPSRESGFSLNTVPRQKDGDIVIQVPFPVAPGSMVYITSSTDLTHRAREIVAHPADTLRHLVPLDLNVAVRPGGRLELNGRIQTRNGKELTVEYRSDPLLIPARTHPLSPDQLRQQLMKTGDSPFLIIPVTLTYSGDMFAPLARLNYARRQFLALAEEVLVASFLPSPEQVDEAHRRRNDRPERALQCSGSAGSSPSSPLVLSVYTDSLETVRGAVEGGCDAICFEPVFTHPSTSCCVHGYMSSSQTQISTAFGLCREKGVRFICKLPKITRDAFFDAFLPSVPGLAAKGIAEYMVENCGAAYALLHSDQELTISGSTGLNIFNHEAVRALFPFSGQLTLSPELSRDEIRTLTHAARVRGLANRFAFLVQGTSEVMISEDCLLQPWSGCNGKEQGANAARFSGIRDSTGHIFPVRVDGECRTHIYNAAELCLIDHLPSLVESGINEVVIDARGRTGTYAKDMTRLYREAIILVHKGIRHDDQRFAALKDEVRCRSFGSITTGHFIRGLKE